MDDRDRVKLHAMVFTPPGLVDSMLALIDPRTWSDPDQRVLFPAAGTGHIVLGTYSRFWTGLSRAIPSTRARHRHIVKTMFCCYEIDQRNAAALRKALGPDLTLHVQDYLGIQATPEAYTLVVENPPFQRPSASKRANGGSSLWPAFVGKCYDALADGGQLVMLHPPGWRRPGHPLRPILFADRMTSLQIFDKRTGERLFGASTRFDMYHLRKGGPRVKCRVTFDDGSTAQVKMSSCPALPNHGWPLFQRVLKQTAAAGPLPVLGDSALHTSSPGVSATRDARFRYPVINGVGVRGDLHLVWSLTPHQHQSRPKVIISENERLTSVADSGRYGVTQHCCYILCKSLAAAERLQAFIHSAAVGKVVNSLKWGNYATERAALRLLPDIIAH